MITFQEAIEDTVKTKMVMKNLKLLHLLIKEY